MKLYPFEATNGGNWGKFAVGKPDTEWHWRSQIDAMNLPLLRQVGWGHDTIWVWDLETGEGAMFRPGGLAGADLNKHKIWVCPLFEPFLAWLYQQDLRDLEKLPRMVELPDAPFSWHGYRRAGVNDEAGGEG
jgi:hypothetical protein